MSLQEVDIGSVANDHTGDTPREAGAKINDNFAALQAAVLDTQTANKIYAGPASGGGAAPSWRALVNADIPTALSIASLVLTAASISATPLTLNQFSTSQTAALLQLVAGNSAAASGSWILCERPASSSNNGVPWRAIVNQNNFTTYRNEVFDFSWNASITVGVPAVAGKALFGDRWEYKYETTSVPGDYFCERHVGVVVDTSLVEHRMLSMSGAWDGSTGFGGFSLDQIGFATFAGVQKIQWRPSFNDCFIGDGTNAFTFNWSKNNTSAIRQRNAADSDYLDVIYLDDGDTARIPSRLFCYGSRITGGSAYTGVLATFQLDGTPSNGDSILNIIGATTTGTLYAANAGASATTAFAYRLRNANSGGASVLELYKESTDTGDPYVKLNINGGTAWYVGVDNSSSDKFIIGTGAPGAADIFSIAAADGTATLASGTVTASIPIFSLSQTWNSGATVFTAFKINITATAAANLSPWIDLQSGGNSLVQAGGYGTNASDAGFIWLSKSNNNGGLLACGTNGYIGISIGAAITNSIAYLGGSGLPYGLRVRSDASYSWSNSGSNAGATADTLLTRPAAATIQQGDADVNGNAVAQTLMVQSAVTGTDKNGGDWTFKASRQTGAGTPGNIIFQVASKLATGTTQGTPATALTLAYGALNMQPSVVVGNQALATNATDGFLYIPGGAGAPTGTPTAFSGRYPLYWDHTNKKLYLYDGSWLGGTAPGVWS